MKLTTVLLLFATLQISAVGFSQEARVNIKVSNGNIVDVFNEIEKQTEFRVFYKVDLLDMNKKINLEVKDIQVKELLSGLLAQSGSTYDLVDRIIVITPEKAKQTTTIRGKIMDAANGEPLIGVNIVVEGTTNGTVSDINGAYSIDVPSLNAILSFSFIGYISEKVSIGGRNTVDVSLKSDIKELDEVVVVGYGVVKKRDLTGSVSSIKSNEITKVATNNAMQAMQGRVAGLDISKSSGETGAGISIDLRGNRSINASNNPLILVDGIEYGSTIDLNSSDIESMEVLKDASSTAIYGTRGANGVIIITTKRGTNLANQKPRVTYNTYFSSNSPTNLPKIMSAQQDYLLLAERRRYAAELPTQNWGSSNLADFTPEVVFSDIISSPYEKSLLTLYNEGGVNWFDIIMRNSLSQNHELSIAGSGEKTSFSLSLGFMNEQGLLKNDNLNRYNARLNLDHAISKKIKIGTSIQYTYKDWDRREDGVYSQAIKMHSIAQPYLADGTILDKPSELATSHTNPLLNEVSGYYQNNTQSNRFFGNIFGEVELVKNLKFKSIFGLDQQFSRKGVYEDYMCTANYQSGRGSDFLVHNVNSSGFTWENTLNYLYSVNQKFELQALLGQSAMKNIDEYHETSGFGKQDHYGLGGFYDLTNITPDGRAVDNQYVKKTMLSYFGRLNMKFLGKYLLTGSLRADGSSVLSAGNKWGYFPSVAGAWVASEEPFLKSVDAISNLKLRSSWGKSGNAAVNPYQTITALGTTKTYYTFGSTLITGLVPAILGNPDLTWETTSTWDVGADFSVLKNKLNLTFDYYMSKTNDLLLYKGLPASSVYPQVLSNVGKTENKGFEIALNAHIIETKNFRWTADLTYASNRDKIVELASGATRDVSVPDQALVVGEPVRAFYGYEADGCWETDEVATAAKYGKIPGAVKIVDQDKDSVINDNDKILYNKSPKFILGLNNNFEFYNFSLSVLVYARVGQWIKYDLNTAYKPTEQDGSPALDFWTPENQGAKFPRPGIASQSDLPALAFEKASYLKIKDVTLAYSLPVSLASKLKLSKVRVYGSLQNYFTFSNLDNYDPERGGAISNPLAKQLVFGLNVEF